LGDDINKEVDSVLVGNKLFTKSVINKGFGKKTSISNLVNCFECGTECDIDNVFCIKCGAELDTK
jgi:hypothetical protein